MRSAVDSTVIVYSDNLTWDIAVYLCIRVLGLLSTRKANFSKLLGRIYQTGRRCRASIADSLSLSSSQSVVPADTLKSNLVEWNRGISRRRRDSTKHCCRVFRVRKVSSWFQVFRRGIV